MITDLNDSLHYIAVAHLRAATSGASSIQNPHPWIFESDSVYSFVHNGGASKDVLYNIITENGTDVSWFIQNPPQTYGNGDWQDEGWNSVVDSELIMLLIMKEITAYSSVIEGLQSALSKMLSTGIYPSMLNYKDAVVITDIDIIPTNRQYFIDSLFKKKTWIQC